MNLRATVPVPVPVPVVNITRCSGCGRCVAACPLRIVTLDVCDYRKLATIRHPERCSRCDRCITSCPVGAFTAAIRNIP